MSTSSNYKGTIELIGGLQPKNNEDFPLIESHAVFIADSNKRLDTELEEIKNSVVTRTDETLSLKDGELKVNTTNEIAANNNLPITAAAVYNTIGDINTILTSI